APDFDVRETEWAYFLEGEFPGIKDRDSIRLEWVDYRTLAIETRIPRIDLAEEWEWLSERRVGLYQRTFTFPADVDASQVRARLGQGLLRILVPKIRERRGSGRKV
ncbi:HSP20-like chaperone, partial [Zopfia rhizophila CBS 207.26]